MFAARNQWNFSAPPLAARVAASRAAGTRIFDLTETNPTRCGFSFYDDLTRQALADPATLRYEPDPRGPRAARECIAGYYAERGAHVLPDRIFLTASTSEAYGFVMRLLHEPGDTLLVPAPSYPLFDYLAALQDVRTVPYALHYDGRWWTDVAGVTALLDERVRACVCVSPNNPTGSYVLPSEILKLGQALGTNRALVVDEVFADFALDPPEDMQPQIDAGVLTFTLNGLSKCLGLPQMKVAWLVVGGPDALAEAACERLELIADTYLSLAAPGACALPAWMARRTEVQAEIRDRLRRNLSMLRSALGAHAACLPVEGGWSAVVRIPAIGTDADRALALLTHDGVLVDPGSFYGFPHPGYLVLSLLTPTEVFAEGSARLAAAIEREASA